MKINRFVCFVIVNWCLGDYWIIDIKIFIKKKVLFNCMVIEWSKKKKLKWNCVIRKIFINYIFDR